VAALLRGSEIDFIADPDDHEAAWSAIHAAYLINEVDPNAMISIRAGRSTARDPRQTAQQRVEPSRQIPGRRAAFPDPFSRSYPSYPLYQDDEASRVVTAEEWLAEQTNLDRAHWSYVTNFLVLGLGLFTRICKPADNTGQILDAVAPSIAKIIKNELLNGLSELAHPAAMQRFAELAESTEAQRLVLFDQFFNAKKPEDFRPTLGDGFICGSSFGTDLDVIRRARYSLPMLSALIGVGAVQVDFDRRIIELTPEGRRVADILANCLDIREYQTVIIDCLAGRAKESRLEALEGWIIRHFELLKLELAKLDV
jgi:hypothetical protein